MSNESSEITGWSGHRRMTLDELAIMASPGLGIIMPRVSRRYWILYYAAKEGHWEMAKFQLHEIEELLESGSYSRPKYQEHIDEFMTVNLKPVEDAIAKQDWQAFEKAYNDGITAANAYHEAHNKEFIVWKLPDTPPPDMDLKPPSK